MIPDKQLQSEVFINLEVLTEEKNLAKFWSMSVKFKESYKNKCKEFVEFFDTHYLNRSANWAMSSRQFAHAKTDTNMYIESFHNRLKTFYMNKRLNKRLDDLIKILLIIEEEDHWRHRKQMLYESGRNMQKQTSRHKRGIKIKDIDVEQVSESKWNIKSQTSSNDDDDDDDENTEMYEAYMKHTDCFEDLCFTRCLEIGCCNLCSHMYECSCPDTANLCKHIHKIQSLRVRSFQIPILNTNYIPDNDNTDYTDDNGSLNFYNTKTAQLDRRTQENKSKIKRAVIAHEKIHNHLNDETVKALALDKMLHTLEELNLYCERIKNIGSTELTPFKETLTFAPNAKHKHKRVKGRYSDPKKQKKSITETKKLSFIQTSKKKEEKKS